MSELLKTENAEGVARVAIDDGKANAVSPALIRALHAALDAAEKDASALVLTGRTGRFSAGFDLSVLGSGGEAANALVSSGAELLVRLMEFPKPVVVACSGHAIAAGALLVLSGDWRIGARGVFKIGLNEVAIGMALPHFAREMADARLSRRHRLRATQQAEMYSPEGALDAGYFDALCDPEALLDEAQAQAERLAKLDARAFARTKRATIAATTASIREHLESDLARLLPQAR